MSLACSDCASPISTQSRTGRCRKCALARINADPSVSARRTASIRQKYHDDPTYRARKTREIHARHMAARRDPETAARLNGNIHIARARLKDPEVYAKWRAGRMAAAAKRAETVMAWCPVRLRDLYRHLVRSKKLPASEARKVVEAEISAFDRQLIAVRNGAKLIAKPDLRKTDYAFTLGGVVGMLG